MIYLRAYFFNSDKVPLNKSKSTGPLIPDAVPLSENCHIIQGTELKGFLLYCNLLPKLSTHLYYYSNGHYKNGRLCILWV